MSSHKTKNKSTAKKVKSTKSVGKNKAAVMNSRDPKKPMAISGDTMSNYAMYKKGGKVKKYKTGGPGDGKKKVDLGDDLSISNNVQSFFKDPSLTNAVRVAGRINPITQAARLATEAITRTGAALGNEKMKKQAEERDRKYEANRRALAEQKKGGKVKRYKVGGSKFPDLTGDGKVTQADVLKGRGVFKKGGMTKSKKK